MSTQEPENNEIRDLVKQKYGEAARIAMQATTAPSWCGPVS
jgi:hypothetical protein